MLHHLQHIVDLVEICRLKGIQQVVVSPGSRNAPLIKLFSSNPFFKLHSIVDERSAAFYGLGISLSSRKPVALLCTSGTAVLNYAPALAEAYYQHIPLIAITADRPEELIDQQDNQTIRQVNVYSNYIRKSIHLHQTLKGELELRAQHSSINKIINKSITGIQGPVHINVPISEPLYAEMPPCSSNIQISDHVNPATSSITELNNNWANCSKRLIICGEGQHNNTLNKQLNAIADDGNAIVLAEPISNITGKNILSEVDRLMMLIESE
ncbi:MAG: 2-succinyl-5-enolpyruvyl-6-hydroxy-3-cyclohexene-1-carboxylic-acid synthase, partial [Prolixibacteraceae bacterium]|nr:2-succinyl-5-enolpyruvyl-6-hydroxy-3-cyclohexene-1-carboxylic-acid synthase [Prolixibacteraceae bacterium]